MNNVTKLVLDPFAKQNTIPERRANHRMIYGFTFSTEELEEWGRQHFDDTDDEKVWKAILLGSISAAVACGKGRLSTSLRSTRSPRRHESDWCLTLADTISSDTVAPPPREVIDKMKEALQITRDPQWHRFDGD